MNDLAGKNTIISSLRDVFKVREAPIFIYVIVMIAVFSSTIDGFFSMKNFEIISRQITTIGIVSVGMTLVILSGGFDLSVGAILSFAINRALAPSILIPVGSALTYTIGSILFLPDPDPASPIIR